MKYLRYLLIAIGLCFLPATAQATCGAGSGTCFVVPAGGTWASGTFSSTSGGTSCACTPASTDALILDSLAGNLTSIVGNPTIASLDASGTGGSGSPYTGTLTHSSSQTLTISGNLFKLVAGMTYTIGGTNSTIAFTSTSGTTLITTGTQTLPVLVFNGVGGTFQPQDALTNNGGLVTLTNGTLDAATHNVALSTGGFSSSNSNTRTINCGTNTWTLTPPSGVSAWDLTTGTNLTISCASNTFNIVQSSASAASGVNFIYGGSGCTGCNSYGTISVGAMSVPPQGFFFTGSVAWTVATLNVTAPNNIRFPNSATTVTNALTWTGSASNPIYASWSGAGGTSSNNVTVANSTVDWATFRGIHFVTGTVTANDCLSFGGNSGLTCNAPSGGGGGGGHIIGG